MRAAAARAHASSARTCTSTWSRWTRARPTLELVLELLAEPEFARRAVGRASCCRPTCATRPSTLERVLDWARAHRARAAARRAAGQGRLLGPRGRRGAPARLDAAGVRGQGRVATATSRRSPGGCSTRGRTCAPRSRRTTCARSRTRSPTTARSGGADRDLELQVLRGLGDDLAAALADHGPARAHLLPGRRPRRRHGLPRAAAAREHRPTTRSWASSSAARRSRSCCAAP